MNQRIPNLHDLEFLSQVYTEINSIPDPVARSGKVNTFYRAFMNFRPPEPPAAKVISAVLGILELGRKQLNGEVGRALDALNGSYSANGILTYHQIGAEHKASEFICLDIEHYSGAGPKEE